MTILSGSVMLLQTRRHLTRLGLASLAVVVGHQTLAALSGTVPCRVPVLWPSSPLLRAWLPSRARAHCAPRFSCGKDLRSWAGTSEATWSRMGCCTPTCLKYRGARPRALSPLSTVHLPLRRQPPHPVGSASFRVACPRWWVPPALPCVRRPRP